MADPIDVHVGSRVRMRRTLMGMTQHQLGSAVGLTFQQIQKYERGSNRIGSSRLFQLSQLLDADIAYFFGDMPEEITGFGRKGMSEEGVPYEVDRTILKRETLELVRAYYKIDGPNLRQKLRDMMDAVSESNF